MIDPKIKEAINLILNGTLKPSLFYAVEVWRLSTLLNPSPQYELKLRAINEVMSGHGIEPLWVHHASHPIAFYVNMGDSYKETVLFSYPDSEFIYSSMGDYIERLEKEGIKIK